MSSRPSLVFLVEKNWGWLLQNASQVLCTAKRVVWRICSPACPAFFSCFSTKRSWIQFVVFFLRVERRQTVCCWWVGHNWDKYVPSFCDKTWSFGVPTCKKNTQRKQFEVMFSQVRCKFKWKDGHLILSHPSVQLPESTQIPSLNSVMKSSLWDV